MTEDKSRENLWTPMLYEYNPPNGLRFPYTKFYLDQFQNLNLEGDNSLHCSSSSSRSGTPPDTPSTTPSVIPQGPGRGDCKNNRVNGIPPFMANPPQLCDANQPPPPPPPYSNCSVPYSSYPPPIHTIPSRFSYTQPRFPFNQSFSYQQHPEGFPSYHYHVSSQPIHRTVYCYNCGANNHTGAECSGQTIEDITQKPYVLEFNPPLSDMDKT